MIEQGLRKGGRRGIRLGRVVRFFVIVRLGHVGSVFVGKSLTKI